MVLDLSSVELPVSPSPDARPFWAACAEGRLVVPHCTDCNHSFFYPRAVCPSCGSRGIGWKDASGQGVVHAFCIHHHTSLDFLRPLVPFVTALVRLEEGPRVMALLDVPADPSAVRCELPVEATFVPTAGGAVVPVFAPVGEINWADRGP